MAFKLAELFTDLTVRDGKFKTSLKSNKRSLETMRKQLRSTALAAGAMLAGASFAGLKLIKLAGEQEQAEKRLANAVKSSGGAAGFSTREMIKHAQSLQDVTRYGDEAIIAGQALLSTFTNIRGPQFRQATEAMLNLSTVMGIDLKQAAIQLGKALNDPILGISAMSRSGVSFTKQEKEMIKSLVEANKTMEAQMVILKALDSQGMAGAARADARTMLGEFDQMVNAAGDLGEVIGEALSPITSELIWLIREWTSILGKPKLQSAIAAPDSAGFGPGGERFTGQHEGRGLADASLSSIAESNARMAGAVERIELKGGGLQ